jgi:hypothetical protein
VTNPLPLPPPLFLYTLPVTQDQTLSTSLSINLSLTVAALRLPLSSSRREWCPLPLTCRLIALPCIAAAGGSSVLSPPGFST